MRRRAAIASLAVFVACATAPPTVSFSPEIALSAQLSDVEAIEVYIMKEQTSTGEILSCSGIGAKDIRSIEGVDLLSYALAKSGETIELEAIDAEHPMVIVADAFTQADAIGAPIGRGCLDQITLRAGAVNHQTVTLQPIQ